MKRILILGGGMSGLIASYVFGQCRDVSVKVFEPGRPGAEFLSGGLKYIHKTGAMSKLLSDVGVVYTNYHVVGGILLHEKVEPYPAALRSMGKERALRIQHDHYRKTRRTEPDAFAARSMNDPESTGPRKALRCDATALVQKLIERTLIIRRTVSKIQTNGVFDQTGELHPYDYLICTIPLWILRHLLWFDLPEAMAMKLNIVRVDPHGDRYAKWDYVYTPYTPEGLVHRISPGEGGYSCEFNGEWIEGETNLKLTNELNFLFPDGWALNDVQKGKNGHLLPLVGPQEWPANVRPLGRFAQWDSRATTDAVLETAIGLVKEWGLKRIV